MSKKVLIADDELYILESVSYVVKQAGYEVITAEDGEAAIKLARQEKPALIFLDIMMPKITGFEVCEQLKNNSDTKDIHIIMLTARGQERDERMGMEAGADEYITKPFSPRELRKRLDEILGNEGKEDKQTNRLLYQNTPLSSLGFWILKIISLIIVMLDITTRFFSMILLNRLN